MMQSSFKLWWGKYKRKLEKRGYNLKLLPHDFEEFINYLDVQPISLYSKQEIVRFIVKDTFGIPYKDSRRNEKKLRRAKRFYHVYFHSASTTIRTPLLMTG